MIAWTLININFTNCLNIQNQIQLRIKVLALVSLYIIELQTILIFASCGGEIKDFRRLLEVKDCSFFKLSENNPSEYTDDRGV